MTDHNPDFNFIPEPGHPLFTYYVHKRFHFYWRCSCGTDTPQRFRSIRAMERSFKEHANPRTTPDPPEHAPTFIELQIGQHEWICSCGARSRPEGYTSAGGAHRSHSLHESQAIEDWYEDLEEIL